MSNTFSKLPKFALRSWGNLDVFSNLVSSYSKKDALKVHSLLQLNEKVLKLASGVKHAALVTESHDQTVQTITLLGLNTSGQLGIPIDSKHPSAFNQISFPPGARILDLALGRQHTVALVQESSQIRSLWGTGSNHFGQLLRPELGKSLAHFQPILHDCSIEKIAAGFDHTVLVNEDGTIATAGWSADGQCGNGQTHTINHMQSISTPWKDKNANTRILAVCAGADHTLVLTEHGQVYAWGNAEYGQCCNGEKLPHLHLPKQVAKKIGKIQMIRTNASSTLLKNDQNEWWYFGFDCQEGHLLRHSTGTSMDSTEVLSTCQHNFVGFNENKVYKGKSDFSLDRKLTVSPLFVSSGSNFTLGVFPHIEEVECH